MGVAMPVYKCIHMYIMGVGMPRNLSLYLYIPIYIYIFIYVYPNICIQKQRTLLPNFLLFSHNKNNCQPGEVKFRSSQTNLTVPIVSPPNGLTGWQIGLVNFFKRFSYFQNNHKNVSFQFFLKDLELFE